MSDASDRIGRLREELESLSKRMQEIEGELGAPAQGLAADPALAVMSSALRRVANVGVFYADADGNCLDVNDQWCKITGRRREEVLGRGYLAALAPADRGRLSAPWARIPPGHAFRGEYTYIRPDGSEVMVESDSVSELDDAGRPTGYVVSTAIDVTAARRAERERTEAESRLRAKLDELETLYEHVPVGLGFIDCDLRFRKVNSLLAAINGRPIEEHLGREVGEVIPQLADQVVPIYRRVLATGEPAENLEITGVLPSDPHVEHTWLVSHHPVRGPGESVRGIITVAQDISEMKRAEHELSQAKSHLVEAQRLAGIGSWQWEASTDEFNWSDEIYRVYDREPSFRPTWDAFYEQVHPDDRPMIKRQLDEVFETGRPEIREFRILLRDGSLRWIRATCAVERAEDGSVQRVVGTAEVIAGPSVRP